MSSNWDKLFNNIPNYYGILEIFASRPADQPLGKKVYIQQCFFSKCYSSDPGAAIYYYNIDGSILVEYCSVIKCSSASSGGFIYAKDCNAIANYVCTFQCTGKFGQSIAFDRGTDSSKSNRMKTITQSSVCSTYEFQGSKAPITLNYGNQTCTFVNITNYKVESYSSIFYESCYAGPGILRYDSFISNFATSDICIFIEGYKAYEIDQCNLINNIDSFTSFGLIHAEYSPVTIQHCCIMDNIAKNLFSADRSSKITIKNCTLPSKYSISFTDSAQINTKSANANKPFTNEIILQTNEKYCIKSLSDISSNSNILRSLAKPSSLNLLETILYSSLVYLKK